MELEFNEDQYESSLMETKKNIIEFKTDDENKNKNKS